MQEKHNDELVTLITDRSDDAVAQRLNVRVVSDRNIVEVFVEDHGVKVMEPGQGAIGFFEFYEGRLRFVYFDDINDEDAKVIDFAGARESNRKE